MEFKTKDLWNKEEASKAHSVLEQRVYSSRLIGRDAHLVLHGGGNTSAKGEVTNIFGKQEKALFIKGSGWDLATIEAKGFPAVKLEPLLEARKLEALGDEEMMNFLRNNLFDSKAPDPSVECLLHAYLPHRFIDHTHADAVLTLTNQPGSEATIERLYGKRVALVPWIMPGFQLAKACAEIYEKNPHVEGMILIKHGIFSFGDTAEESYKRMIELVQVAERAIQEKPRTMVSVPAPAKAEQAKWANLIRRSFQKRGFRSVVLLDESKEALELSSHPKLSEISQKGPITPDHIIRTKQVPLVATSIDLDKLLTDYEKKYQGYFNRSCEVRKVKRTMLDTFPRVVIVPGVGIYSLGATEKDAKIARDIYNQTASVLLDSTHMSSYECLPDEDLFDMEYWILEQNKLKLGPKRSPLSGKVAVVTGASSGIGAAVLSELTTQGATVFNLDLNPGKAGKHIKVDVTNRESVKNAFEEIVRLTGGVDITVINAGIFPASSPIESISLDDWNKSINVNLNGAFHTVAETLKWMKEQGTGGDLVFVASKNVPAPGKEAAAYSVAKAGQAQLARVAALEGGAFGIRVNMLHPHMIFDTGIWTEEVLQKRAKAYGMTVEQYKTNNLLKTPLDSQDVAKAVFALVSGAFGKTTGAQIPIDGGSDRTL